MFAKWFEEYQRLSQKMRFFSQLASFLIAIVSFFSLYELTRVFYFEPEYLNKFIEEESRFLYSVTFQISLFIIFALRFVVLFFKTAKAFWLGQGLCLIGLIFLASYWLESRPPGAYYHFFPNEWIIFRHASRSLELYGLYYLLLSPIRQFITLIISLSKVRSKI